MTPQDSQHIARYLSAFGVGALIGVGVALLYAPHSGRETRRMLVTRGRKLKLKAIHAFDEAKQFVRGQQANWRDAIKTGKRALHARHANH